VTLKKAFGCLLKETMECVWYVTNQSEADSVRDRQQKIRTYCSMYD